MENLNISADPWFALGIVVFCLAPRRARGCMRLKNRAIKELDLLIAFS
jgi:hypothetical protein